MTLAEIDSYTDVKELLRGLSGDQPSNQLGNCKVTKRFADYHKSGC